MTRKRYIKCLMALGVSRNRANVMATACRGPGGKSYAQDFADREPWLRLEYSAKCVAKALAFALQGVVLSAQKIAADIGQTLHLVVHHNAPGPNSGLRIMTQAEHAALHGHGGGGND